jgi:hypothetical protein
MVGRFDPEEDRQSRNGTNSGQDRSHMPIIAGYFSRQISANSAKRSSAAAMVGEV